MKAVLKFELRGPFRVESADGRVLTPKAAKEQGLLLLLLTAPHQERSRIWLQDKLWSDRSQQQGSASLRQALSQLRRAFGDCGDILQTDRRTVRLDPDRLDIRRDGSAEFAEGLDVRDDEFDLWLSGQRARPEPESPLDVAMIAQPVAPVVGPWSIAITESGRSTGICEWVEKLVADRIGHSLDEFFITDILRLPDPTTALGRWVVNVEAFAHGSDRLAVRVLLSEGGGRRQLWTGHRDLSSAKEMATDNAELLQLANELVEIVGDLLIDNRRRPPESSLADHFSRVAIRKMFRIRPDTVREADELLEKACQISPRGLYYAWRAQLRTIQRVERHSPDTAALQESGAWFAARAMELEPNNSMVLATVANTHLHLLGNPASCLELAGRSVALNPANPMAWWALSSARLYSGKARQAYADAIRARDLARLSPNRFWWDQQQFGAAMLLGRIPEALRLLENVIAQCPDFRPPLRYLVALNAHLGEEDRAIGYAEQLKKLEPDFSIEQMIGDNHYPASLIRRAGYLDIDRLAGLT
ncbi:hypothetical protein [uncultured Paracoccus sp.]|uniref:hypothetical protein n=1 Tax=uncultured Paracoccus sp. TaxID=189685 RepID=UPI002611024A|nr:hypothetical protein [uncultured Paracoccus sp.]